MIQFAQICEQLNNSESIIQLYMHIMFLYARSNGIRLVIVWQKYIVHALKKDSKEYCKEWELK